MPNTKNPPGARINISIGFSLRKGIENPLKLPPMRSLIPLRNVPAPRISRIVPITKSAPVKPIPMPRPSTAEASTPFLLAKASALPRIIQLTTISGR